MYLRFSFLFFLSSLVFSSCGEDANFKFFSPKTISISESLHLKTISESGKELDSVLYFLDNKKINPNYSLENERLGKHILKAEVFSEGTSKSLNNTIVFLAPVSPKIYSFEIVNTFPHDKDAFTQGFEFYNGFMYESTGQNGASSIRKTDLQTGKVLQIEKLDEKYFGEGMTIFDNQIFQLTWQGKIGFIYDLDTFQQKGSFPYGQSVEGWGLTHNKTHLIKSDGTERIWFLDPKTQKETHFIEAYTNNRKAERLNEIEFVEGKIYANIWQKSTIIIINPNNGAIEGIVDLGKLSDQIHKIDENTDFVLNGIAYDEATKRLFVTGKNWDKTFEIKLIQQ